VFRRPLLRFLGVASRPTSFLPTAAALLCFAALLSCPTPAARAAIVWSGDVSPDDPTSWTAYTSAYIGGDSFGAITVNDGSDLLSHYGYLGYSSGSNGTATITGTGSTWTHSEDLYVGRSGSGRLTVADGGLVTADCLYASISDLLGDGTIAVEGGVLDADIVFDGTHGPQQTVIPFGTGGTLNVDLHRTSPLGAGYKESGTLRIAGGVTVAASKGYLGYWSGSTGAATVSGAGSTWTNSISLYVGQEGSGTLTVADGGLVTARTLYASLGDLSGDGTIAASGAVLDADLVFDGTHGLQQTIPFGTGGTLELNLGGAGGLGAGHKENGTLTIAEGLAVTSSSGYLGHTSGSTGTATVTGTGSEWTNTHLHVGVDGSGSLSVEAGGHVSSTTGYLGYAPGSTGAATITGVGSTWTNTYSLYVGPSGTGMLTVADGGSVTARTLYASLGDLFGDGTITANGAVLDGDLVFDGTHGPQQTILSFGTGGTLGLNLDGTAELGAGWHGSGTLRIAQGATIASSGGRLGYYSGSTGTATVAGAGSQWVNSGDLYIGREGHGTLTIEAGGQVTDAAGYVGYGPDSAGAANVTGDGSTWTHSGTLYIGRMGSGTLRVEAGGRVSNSDGYLGHLSGSIGAATVVGAGSTWANSGTLYIGRMGSGTLTVADGGSVTANELYASVSDLLGDGTITTQGAVLDGDFVFDGTHGPQQTAVPFGTGGTLSVHADGSAELGAGYRGTGTMTVADGATVLSSSGYLGYDPGSNGTATVTGDGSEWTSSTSLYVGRFGSGTLDIHAGGHVSNVTGFLGGTSDSTGRATVTGTGSTWSNSGSLYVGSSGSGTLTVADGGSVTARTLFASLSDLSGDGTIATQGAVLDADLVFDNTHGPEQTLAFGTGGTLSFNGTGTVGAGYNAAGTLKVAGGVTLTSSAVYLGHNPGSTGTATVTDAGTTWTNGGFSVGYAGNATLLVNAGALVSSDAGYLGDLRGSTGIATVTGAGSTWNSNRFYVGRSGSGALRIEAGGQVTNLSAVVAEGAKSNGTVTVTGPGSQWTSSHSLVIGLNGSGTLTVEAGGQASGPDAYLGRNPGSNGTATITGAGSTWTLSGNLNVGNAGAGALNVEAGGQVSCMDAWVGSEYGSGQLTVADGGSVTARTLYASVSDLSGNGTITVTAGAVLDADLIFDGTHGPGQTVAFGTGGTIRLDFDGTGDVGAGYKGTGTLRIADGATVASSCGYLGYNYHSSGTATVAGTDSAWTNSSDLYVGHRGSGTLSIEAGGQVSNRFGYLGYNRNSTGTATVTGAGSTWTSSIFYVGRSGSGTLAIEAGGQMTSGTGYLGRYSGSSGTATVTGAGSTWTSSYLYVGEKGSGRLTVADGGSVTARTLYASLGDLFGDGTITVTHGAVLDADLVFDGCQAPEQTIPFGTGGTLNVNIDDDGALGAGYKESGTLKIAGGTTVASCSGYLGFGSGSTGTATVAGAGSRWTNSSTLYVGRKGNGTLNIEAGGQVSNTTGYLGRYSGSAGTVTVIGTGSTWTNGSDLYVGDSGNGTLTVADAGQVGVGGQFVVYQRGTVAWGLGEGDDARIAVTGTAQLDAGSTLQLQVVGVGAPGLARHTILTAGGGVAGSFSNVPPVHLPGGGAAGHLGLGVFHRGLNYEGRVEPGDPASAVSVDLLVVAGGDANGDGVVDDLDANLLAANFNGNDPLAAADRAWTDGDMAGGATGRGDGFVDGQDLSTLIAQWTGPGGGAGGSASARYCPATGEVVVSADALMSWTLTSDGRFLASRFSSVLDALIANGQGELPSANANTIGQGSLAGQIGYAEPLHLGQVVAPDTPPDDLLLEYVTGFGGEKLRGTISLIVEPHVVDRRVFYNHSSFDANDASLDAGDAAAVAIDKHALRPGETATADNYTSFSRGLNGVLVDVVNLADPAGLDADHVAEYFRFRTGNDDDPAAWSDAPPIEDILIRPGEGQDGSDRVMITWPDRAIENEWLEVTLLAGERTGLDEDDVFYFGNAPGESGNAADNALVTVADLLLARNHRHGLLDPAGIDDPYDYNRDGRVNTTDVLLARNHQTGFPGGLELISPATHATEVRIAPVPEPSSLVLMAMGAVALLLHARRRPEGALWESPGQRAGKGSGHEL